MAASLDTASSTLRFAVIPRVAERPFWSIAVRPSSGDVVGLLILIGLTVLLTPLAAATAPFGILIAAAPWALLTAMLVDTGRRYQRRLEASRETLAVDPDGIHGRHGSIVMTWPSSRVTRAWRHRDTVYVRLADFDGTLVLDASNLDDPASDQLLDVLRTGRDAEEPEGTAVARWKVTSAHHRRAVAAADRERGAPVLGRRTPWLGWGAGLALLALVTLGPDSSNPIVAIAIVLGFFAVLRLVELLWDEWRWSRVEPNTLTITAAGLVEHEFGRRRVVSIPWPAVARLSVRDGEVQIVTDPVGVILIPARAIDDHERGMLRSAVERHRPEALADDGD